MPRKSEIYSYPTYDIDLALNKLQEAYDTIKNDEMKREVVADALNMAYRGGAFAGLMSSLEKYGLIETGWGTITITETGKLAIYGLESEKEIAKSEAVLNVLLFNEIYQKYGTDATVDQFRAFLRQEANMDVTKVGDRAEQACKIYKKASNYIQSTIPLEQAPKVEPASSGRGENIVPPTVTSTQPLKIQYGDVFIQVPPNDLKAIALAKQALEFMESVVRKQQEQEET